MSMMKNKYIDRPFIILGAGGHGRVVLDLLNDLGCKILYFVDSNINYWGKKVEGVHVIGPDEEVFNIDVEKVYLVNGVGGIKNNDKREILYNKFKSRGYSFLKLVHRTSYVSNSVTIGNGSVVMAKAVIQTGCEVGENVIINNGALIDHDCIINDHSHISPGVVLSGSVVVGCKVHIGTGAVIIQNIKIEDESIIAAGAVVTKNVNARTLVAGVPAKKIKEI